MNGYERMMTALRRQEPDRVPVWELIVNEPVIKALYGDISYEDFVEKDDLDGITIFEDQRIVERFSDTQFKDEWGIMWTIEPNGIPYPSGGPIKTEADLDKYTRIRASVDHLTDLLSDMNTLTPEIHAASGYSTLISAVESCQLLGLF